ncbi:MAG: acyl-CoA dehydrogenase [Candidatus Marinimicrobia bacterium]|nr:acyl-CoA dehydrogenase [Candidatus Neomarinimicrobiota bacterium]MCF7829908.1 acyl-CoA dehydrogenase [Candidatus Neomarinimicrobiota bacterium]MCF7879129.1 acyl-CoA dehydrogenase [Candidatus Neomarinimicrobiota bacterium]
MDFTLSEEQQMIQKTARDFAESELAHDVVDRDEKGIFPEKAVKQLGKMGFLGMITPEEYGGAGFDMLSYVLALEEIARVDASTCVIMSVTNSLCQYVITAFGTEEQKQKYLPPLASGEKLGAYALSEPQSGSDAANMKTIAEKKGDVYVLNGTKNWVTNGKSAGTYIVFALTEKNVGHKGVSAFIVENDFDGLTTGKKEDKLGIRSSDTCELIFNDCEVPAENLLWEEGKGFRIALNTLDGGRIGIAAQALGIGQAALDKSLAYAKEREQFNRSISEFQAIQFKLAQMGTEIEAARMLTYKAAVKRDSKEKATKAAAMAKMYAGDTAMRAANEAVQIHGGYGYITEYGVERLMRDAKITQIYEGTNEIQRAVIARELLKE